MTYNFGQNYKGSCGYVAIGMLLSYYDTYLNDSIIPEKYDVASAGFETDMIKRRNSPGIQRDALLKPNGDVADYNYTSILPTDEYYSFIQSISEQSLHAKLITMGGERGYYDFDFTKYPCGTGFTERLEILEDYFQQLTSYSTEDYSFEYINGESSYSNNSAVRNFTIEKIKEGYPVLLSINGSRGGHVVVAYDYDEASNKIYCHMGWGAGTTHVTIESHGFNWYKTALVINFNLIHSHSNNYGVTTVDSINKTSNSYYCYDDCRILTYMQRPHSYTDRYEVIENGHIAYCTCGQFVTEEHSYIHHYDNNGLVHTAYCLCGASKVDVHNYTNFYVKFGSEEYHYAYCACGEKKEEKHIWVREADSSGKVTFKRCKKCLYLIKLRDDEGIQVPIVKRDEEYDCA